MTPLGILQSRIFRYALVGGVAFIADITTLYGLTAYGGVNYLLSAASGFALGLSINYWLSLRFVFRDLGKRTDWTFSLFLFIGLAGLAMNEAIIWFFTETIGLHYLASKLVSVVIVFFWNYGARKKMCFEVKSEDG